MRSPYLFIAKPLDDRRYNNTKKIGDVDFITSTSEENHMASNRIAEVVSTPIAYNGPIKPGDKLLVHHNVFKFYNDMQGRRKSGRSHFMDNLFFVEPDQFYMYHNGDRWNSYDRYCFIKPVPTEDYYIYKALTEEPLVGEVRYSNDYLRSQGIDTGDRVTFKPESEYEFEVDGEKLYRMFDHQITIKL
tara:strand:- start:17810 stop:18373 length:564 start_codon:yes stop_codon:yes gene_type:complete